VFISWDVSVLQRIVQPFVVVHRFLRGHPTVHITSTVECLSVAVAEWDISRLVVAGLHGVRAPRRIVCRGDDRSPEVDREVDLGADLHGVGREVERERLHAVTVPRQATTVANEM